MDRDATRPVWAMVVVLLSAALAACTQAPTTPDPVAPPPTVAPLPVDPSVPDGLRPFYEQQLTWGPCAEFATSSGDRLAFSNAKFDCARIEVPIDYAAPQGSTAQLGLLRQRASGERIGSLLFNPGGPGGSGMSLVPRLSPVLTLSPLGQRFDLVGFDPRGVGASTPTIDCIDNREWEAERADNDVDVSPEGIARSEAETRQFVQQCIERSGGVSFLANVGTRDVVRDLDVIRHVLGDPKLSYVGYSYGTRIGTGYAEAFPQNVRALVLDGALDPTQSAADGLVAQYAAFQQAFVAFAADCATTRPDCPLGQDPAQATAAWQALTRPLIDAPLPADDRRLHYGDALIGLIAALYSEAAWPVLADAIQAARSGDGAPLLQLADFYYQLDAQGNYSNTTEAQTAINCMDEDRVTDREQVAEVARRLIEVAPFADAGRGISGELDACAFWPVPPTSAPHTAEVSGLPPTLVVSVTGDPATPYQAGVDLAAALGSSLVSVEGTQHTAGLMGNRCVDDVITAYLVDLTLPESQVGCTL